MAVRKLPFVSPDEYLAQERLSATKHEYYAGQIFAMAGASLDHARLISNLIATLRSQLAGRDCDVVANDVRIRVEHTTLFTYPDVVVVCDPPVFFDVRQDTILNPLVLIEVLSDSTEAYDRGEKFAHYRTIASLSDYLLVSQSRRRIEHFSRQTDDGWHLQIAERADDAVRLTSLPVVLTLEAVYYRVDVPLFTVSETRPGEAS
jgi:Uma2 family endonuclease